MKNTQYITTTLPYVNADPHIGFALEIIQADTVTRHYRLLNHDVFFNFGTDEHGLKIYKKAKEQNKDPKAYCDEYAKKFDNLKHALNVSYNSFIRTTEKHHIEAAQEFWKRCEKNGDIDKKLYKSKYCVGCELEKTDSELINKRCPLHPNRDLEIIEEENYFFKFSNYQQKLLTLYQNNPSFITPSFRQKEIEEFVKGGLKDFSISRLKQKMPWGIPVPNDDDHVMYVWFDALVNYVSAIGWPNNLTLFNTWWPVIQFAGKDNLRQQSAIWQAMLMSAGLPHSKQICIHGFITSNGQKMSKSLGNVVSPYDVVKKYGTDATRYYLLSAIHPYKDSDFTYTKFETIYNADLANGLGNLVARIAKLCENSNTIFSDHKPCIDDTITKHLKSYRFDRALEHLWQLIRTSDLYLNQEKPWKKQGDNVQRTLDSLVSNIRHIAYNLQPFLPNTAEKILDQFKGPKIQSCAPLFPRI